MKNKTVEELASEFSTYTMERYGFIEGFSAQIKTKPKQQYGIKKIKGFNRVINTGWSYIIERI